MLFPLAKSSNANNKDASSPSWSFESAINILQHKHLELLPALKTFLDSNKKLITDPFGFLNNDSQKLKVTQADIDKEEVKLGGILYSIDKTVTDVKTIEVLAKKLNIDPNQVLKSIIQTNEKRILGLDEIKKNFNHINLIPKANANKDNGPEDNNIYDPKNLIYSLEILKEKRQLFTLVISIFKNQTLDPSLEDITNSILINYESMVDKILSNISSDIDTLLDSDLDITSVDDDAINFERSLSLIIKKECALIISEYLRLLIQILIPINPSNKLIKKWFQLMGKTKCFTSMCSENTEKNHHTETIYSLATIASLLFLGLEVEENVFNIKLNYLSDVSVYNEIQKSIFGNDFTSSLIIYGWNIINFSRYLLFEEFPEANDANKFLSGLNFTLEDFRHQVTECILIAEHKREIFDSILEIHDNITFDHIYKVILASFVKALLPFVKITTKSSISFSKLLKAMATLTLETGMESSEAVVAMNEKTFLESFVLDNNYLKAVQIHKLKVPEDLDALACFMNLINVDGKLAYSVLSSMDTYYHIFKNGELKYEYLSNLISANSFANNEPAIDEDVAVLTQDAIIRTIFEPTSNSDYLRIESGAQLKVLRANKNSFSNQSTTEPSENSESPDQWNAAIFKYNYNGWSLIGKTLENLVSGLSLFDENKSSFINERSISKIKDLSEDLSSNEFKTKNDLILCILNLLVTVFSSVTFEEAEDLIKKFQASASLNFFELIFKILKISLQSKDLDKLTLINKLLNNLLQVGGSGISGFSREVWSVLIKSNYFDVNGSGTGGSGDVLNDNNLLLNIIFANQKSKGDYKFGISLINLADSLIIDALSIENVSDNNNNISLKIKDEIISKLTTIFIASYENFFNWDFNKQYQRFEFGILILDLFSKILFTIYSIDLNNPGTKQKSPTYANNPTLVLKNSGNKIINSFLTSNSFDCLTIKPLEAIINNLISFSPMADSLSIETHDNLSLWYENFVYSVFDFNKLMISLRSTILKSDISVLEQSICNNLKSLIKIYLKFPSLKLKIMNLIIGLINSIYGDEKGGKNSDDKKTKNKQPSLLSYLGDSHSKILLNSLAIDLEGTLIDFNLKNSLYDFFANVLEKNQEGLSIMLLTGVSNQKKKDAKSQTGKSILQILKQNVINLNTYPDSVAIHLLDAISFAFNSWSTAQKIGEDDAKFIESLTSYFSNNINYSPEETNELEDLTETIEKTIKNCYRVKLISSIGEILALYLFSCSNQTIIKPILNLLEAPQFLKTYASKIFRVHNYNSNLHLSTHKDFIKYFGNFKLEDFRRTNLNKVRRYGISTVYNLSLMDQLFCSKYEWNDFLRHGVIQTSLNLQYVSSQNNLIKSWGALVSSYVRFKSSNPSNDFIDLASLLLSINNDEGIPAPSFRDIYLARIELAFFLIYNLSKKLHKNETGSMGKQVTDDQINDLFDAVVASLLSEEVNFLVSLSNNDVQLYRSLLRILLITLNLCSNKAYLLEKNPGVLIDLFGKIIASGSKVIIANIQNEMSSQTVSNSKTSGSTHASPITVNKIEDLLSIISIFKSFAAIKFSNEINESLSILLDANETIKYIMELYTYSSSMLIDDEPIFADLALMYIIELISVDVIAEKLLNYGLFSTLINSPISIEIQKGGIRSDLQPRYHHIWSNGLLTIVLILLGKFGPRVIPDTCIFLKSFEKQIDFTLNNWSKDSLIITTPMIRETSQLILLHKVLNLMNFREFIGVSQQDGEGKEAPHFFPGLDTPKQQAKLLDSLNHLLTHPKYLQSRIVVTHFEDQNIIEEELVNSSVANTSYSGSSMIAVKGKSRLASRLINEIKGLCESLNN